MLLLFVAVTLVGAAVGRGGTPPPVFLIPVMIAWLGMVLMWIGNLVLALLHAVKANQGEWSSYPLAGAWARRIMKMG
jgi:uncharacterized Tic20 family protein